MCECVRRNKKQELNTLDETDFVRDVANRVSHYLSQNATDPRITSAKRISQHLSNFRQKSTKDKFRVTDHSSRIPHLLRTAQERELVRSPEQ